jgi:ribosomal protein L35
MKTNKSFSKRLRVTKNGKILSRKAGQNHFNSKDTGRKSLAKGRTQKVVMTQQAKRRFLAQETI